MQLGLSRQQVQALVKAGRFPRAEQGIVLSTRGWWIPAADIATYRVDTDRQARARKRVTVTPTHEEGGT